MHTPILCVSLVLALASSLAAQQGGILPPTLAEQWGNDRTFGYPHGICLDRSGNLYVAQTGAGRADKFRPVQEGR